MSLGTLPPLIALDYGKNQTFDDFMAALKAKAWEIDPNAEELLREMRALIPSRPDRDTAFCRRFTELPFNEPAILASEIGKLTDTPLVISRTSFSPCPPEAVFQICLDFGDKLEDERIYIYARTRKSSIDTESLFVIQMTLHIPTLFLVPPGTMIKKSDKNYLIRA